MSRFPKSARHPNVSALIDKWDVVGDSINVAEDVQLSAFPDLALSEGRVKTEEDLEYFGGARQVVGASAIRALAKSYEALDASGRCGEWGVNMGAIIQAYNASFFAARGFCMLMGFAPLDRGSAITLDAFSEETRRTRKIVRSTNVLRLHKYKRWGHDEVWSLTKRLIDTMQVPESLRDTRNWLRGARIERSSHTRNTFQYDDSLLAPTEIQAFADFPDRIPYDAMDDALPKEIRENYLIAKGLIEMCLLIVGEARMDHLLFLCMSKSRTESALDWGQWA